MMIIQPTCLFFVATDADAKYEWRGLWCVKDSGRLVLVCCGVVPEDLQAGHTSEHAHQALSLYCTRSVHHNIAETGVHLPAL